MNVIKSRFVYHLMAIITVAIWGTTFVSTKILIQHGLSPSDIFFYRFTLAYLCMWCISYKKLFANRVKDELLLLLAGLCGGTIYFITENTALGITLASNVSLIVCTSPVLTTLLSYLFRRKEPFTRHLVYGSIMALIGALFGICRLHALLHSLECLCQGIGSRKKYKLYLYRPFGNSSYFSGHY